MCISISFFIFMIKVLIKVLINHKTDMQNMWYSKQKYEKLRNDDKIIIIIIIIITIIIITIIIIIIIIYLGSTY